MADDNNGVRIIKTDPDPSLATRELVISAISSLKDLMASRDEIFRSRLDADEKAVELLGRYPTAIDVAIEALRNLQNEKFIAAEQARILNFENVTNRLASITAIITADKNENINYRELIAEQTRKNSTDVDAAVKAAFAAANLAVNQQNIANALASDKQGAAFTKDIEKLTVSLAQIQKSGDDKLEEVRKNNDMRVNDIKDRIGTIEGRSGGASSVVGWIFGGLGSLYAVLASIGILIALFNHH